MNYKVVLIATMVLLPVLYTILYRIPSPALKDRAPAFVRRTMW